MRVAMSEQFIRTVAPVGTADYIVVAAWADQLDLQDTCSRLQERCFMVNEAAILATWEYLDKQLTK